MKNLILSIASVLALSNGAFAMALFDLTGTVARVEDGRAVFVTATGEKKIRMKSLSKTDQKMVNEAVATKKQITLKVPPEHLKK